jgi:hypothetical protein
MPGNTTINVMQRAYLPAMWRQVDIAAGQATGLAMSIPGISKVEIPMARKCSIVSVAITLSESITAGLIRFELTKNSVATGKQFDMTSAHGTKHIWEFEPGDLVGDKGNELGMLWGSSGSLTPDGSIEAVLYIEVQWA